MDSLEAVRFLHILLSVILLIQADLALGATRSRDSQSVPLDYRNADITRIVRDIARATDILVIHGDALRGAITLVVPGGVSRHQALELMNVMLAMKGFAAIPTEPHVRKIVPILESVSSSRLERGLPDADGEDPILTLMRLEQADANDVYNALKPYVASKGGHASVYPPTNSIILAGSESQLHRLISIAKAIDQAYDYSLMTRTLRYLDASETASQLEAIFNEAVLSSQRAQIIADSRANMLIIQAPQNRLAEIREFLDESDRPIQGGGRVQVIRILNREPEDVAKVVEGLAAGESVLATSDGGARVGAEARVVRGSVAAIGSDLAGRHVNVAIDRPTRSLVVQTDPDTMEIVLDLIAQLDVMPPRISVEIKALEIQKPSSYAFGLEYFVPLLAPKGPNDLLVVAQSPNASSLAQPPPDSKLYGKFTRDASFALTDLQGVPVALLPTDSIGASIEADETKIFSNLLLNPHITVISGEEHEIFTGNNIPVPVASTGGSGRTVTNPDGTTSTVSNLPGTLVEQRIERHDVGVRLRVRPTVGQEGVIRLDLDIEISDIAGSLAGSVDRVGPTIIQRDIAATMNIRDGEYVVIGTSIDQRDAYSNIGIPLLRDIPFLGALFRTTRKTVIDTEFVVVVSARILRSMDDDAAELIRRRMAFERSLSRVGDLTSMSSAPYAVLLDTLGDEDKAHFMAKTVADDGFVTRVTQWELDGRPVWDIYVADILSFADASGLATRFNRAGWNAEVSVLPVANDMAGE